MAIDTQRWRMSNPQKKMGSPMWRRMIRYVALAALLAVGPALLLWPANDSVAQTSASKATTMKGHPEKQHSAVAVPGVTKPMPAPKKEAKTSHESNWVPGDYYWNGDDWAWSEGYSLDRPWNDAIWIRGHWTQRFWGWTWVPGYWL